MPPDSARSSPTRCSRAPTAPWSSGTRVTTASGPGISTSGGAPPGGRPPRSAGGSACCSWSGRLCFAVGAVPGYVDWVGTDADDDHLLRRLASSSPAPAYLQYLQTVNATRTRRRPRDPRRPRSVSGRGSRDRIDWWRERGAARRHAVLQRDHPRRDRREPRTRRRRIAWCGSPTWSGRSASSSPAGSRGSRSSHGWWSWHPRSLVVVDRRAEPARIDRVRRVGRRVVDRPDDAASPATSCS